MQGRPGAVRQHAHDIVYALADGSAPPAAGLVGSRVDAWSGYLNRRIWIDPASVRANGASSIVNDPSVGPGTSLESRFLAQQGGYIRKKNGFTSFANRRTAVDVLKKVQKPRARTTSS